MKKDACKMKESLGMIDAIFANKYRQRIISAITGSIGLSFTIISVVIATTKIEDGEDTSNVET